MLLNIIVDDQSMDIRVPPALLEEARDFFARMDSDMDAGWQMGREWIQEPNARQRCQIAANKLLTALENENRKLALMMSGYLLSRIPNIRGVDIDTSGDMIGTEFIVAQASTGATGSASSAAEPEDRSLSENRGRREGKPF